MLLLVVVVGGGDIREAISHCLWTLGASLILLLTLGISVFVIKAFEEVITTMRFITIL